MTSIKEYLNKINYKIEAMANDVSLVDINKNGLMPASDTAPVLNGIPGARGALASGTDLNNVTFGGSYFIPNGNDYKNLPVGSEYTANLTVNRNFNSNPRSEVPIVIQELRTIEFNTPKTFIREYHPNWLGLGDKTGWSAWKGQVQNTVLLWDGNQAINGGKFTLSASFKDFYCLDIWWKPYGGALAYTNLRTFMDNFVISEHHNSVDGLSVVSNTARFTSSSDYKTLTGAMTSNLINQGVTSIPGGADGSTLTTIIGYKSV